MSITFFWKDVRIVSFYITKREYEKTVFVLTQDKNFFFWEIIKPVCKVQWALLDGVLQVELKKKPAFNKAVNTLGEIKVLLSI